MRVERHFDQVWDGMRQIFAVKNEATQRDCFVFIMQCCVSGQTPVDPVISKKGGFLFERSVVEKLILENGTCPVSGEPLTVDDLLVVQSNKAVRPRNTATASIPGMLATFQNEWDEVMLEVFSLKQHLDSTRQELSQALYQHDAACRVIARLMRERDEARVMLAGAGVSHPAPSSSGSSSQSGAAQMEIEQSSNGNNNLAEQGDSWPAMSKAISTVALSLSDARKQRPKKVPPTTRESASFADMSKAVSSKPHKASAEVTCIAVGSDDLMVTAGTDKDLHVLNTSTGKSVVKIATGHKKEVTALALQNGTARGGLLLSGSADSSVKLWSLGESSK